MIEAERRYDSTTFYLSEYQLFNGENYVTFNVLDVNLEKMTVRLAITDLGKIIVEDFDLIKDKNNELYFEYGCQFSRIYLNDFDENIDN